MDYVRGRITDSLRFADGSTVPGEYWTTIFDDWADDIKTFQVVQHADYSIEVKYSPRTARASLAVDAVRRSLERKLAGRATVAFSEASIGGVHSGKTQYVVSHVPHAP
jgi:hypothetical protein